MYGQLLIFSVFLTLRMTGAIDWSWWWVTCPLWGPAVLWIVGLSAILLGTLGLAALIAILTALLDRRRN